MVLVFDIGRTNKKCCVFDEDYRIIFEHAAQLPETVDEEGFACEDVTLLRQWLFEALQLALTAIDTPIQAINFSGYGASFVHLGSDGNPVAPLYNYLKPFSAVLQKQFYDQYGGEEGFSRQTASPVLGNLNSGMQLYRLKYEKPAIFEHIQWSLHLPQYLSYCFTGQVYSDISSIGCHTNLWNFDAQCYADWVEKEGILPKLAPIKTHGQLLQLAPEINTSFIPVGIGLHDSSAALIPYLDCFSEPFVLLSTGTWCISMNPFNAEPLTAKELQKDCLCYLSHQGRPIKSSRLLAGKTHELQVQQLAKQYDKPLNHYQTVVFDQAIIETIQAESKTKPANYETAYHALMLKIVRDQSRSTKLVLGKSGVKHVFVDGGFSMNLLYMQLLARAFPKLAVYAAEVPQASAIGAALAIHAVWNKKEKPRHLIGLKHHPVF
jgi:sugar (pentulose or hexulose) kinase